MTKDPTKQRRSHELEHERVTNIIASSRVTACEAIRAVVTLVALADGNDSAVRVAIGFVAALSSPVMVNAFLATWHDMRHRPSERGRHVRRAGKRPTRPQAKPKTGQY